MRLLAALVAATLALWSQVAATADDRPYLTGLTFAPVAQMRQTGVWEWCYTQEPVGADILPAVSAALEEWSGATGVYMALNCAGGGNLQVASGGNAYIYGTATRAGCGFGSTACLPEYGRNLTIVYDSVSMSGWYLRSQIAVALHEDCHALADCGEQYHHTDGTIYCTNKPWSVMDCGLGHALSLQPFDISLFSAFNYPTPVAGAALQGSRLWYARTNDRATRLPIYGRTYAGYVYWLGLYATPCTGAGWVCGSYVLPQVPFCHEILVGAGNGIAGSWGRDLVSAGWTACY